MGLSQRSGAWGMQKVDLAWRGPSERIWAGLYSSTLRLVPLLHQPLWTRGKKAGRCLCFLRYHSTLQRPNYCLLWKCSISWQVLFLTLYLVSHQLLVVDFQNTSCTLCPPLHLFLYNQTNLSTHYLSLGILWEPHNRSSYCSLHLFWFGPSHVLNAEIETSLMYQGTLSREGHWTHFHPGGQGGLPWACCPSMVGKKWVLAFDPVSGYLYCHEVFRVSYPRSWAHAEGLWVDWVAEDFFWTACGIVA